MHSTFRFRNALSKSSLTSLHFRLLIAVLALIGTTAFAVPAHAQSSMGCDDVTMPANSPPFDCGGEGFDTFHDMNPILCPDGYGITSLKITQHTVNIPEAWAHIDSETRTTGSNTVDGYFYTIRLDVLGKPPGQYSFHFSYSWSALATTGHGSTCTFSYSKTNTNPVTLTSSAGVQLIDPVGSVPPGLMSGNAILASGLDSKANLTKGTTVLGVAADGVTQILVRISTNSPNEQFLLKLMNDQNPQTQSSLPDEDGALGSPGASTFTANQITVSAGSATPGQLAYAFAVYRAPRDFARLLSGGGGFKPGNCQGIPNNDDIATCRTVFVQVQDTTTNTLVGTYPIVVMRSPVILVHGLWAGPAAWDNFYPLVTGSKPIDHDARFAITRAAYDGQIGNQISASDPVYVTWVRANARRNSLGFQYNAPLVRQQVAADIRKFRQGNNPLNLPVGAAQADLVGHSMGGLMARTMILDSVNYLTSETFGEGYIHKLISIDTPHLGSPLATALVAPQEDLGCLQSLLADNGSFAFRQVTIAGQPVSGAVADLKDTPLSPILGQLRDQTPHPIPASMIAGIYNNWSSLQGGHAFAIRNFPKYGCPTDPLARQLNPTDWPQLFNSNPNDAIVLETSQLNNLIPSPGSQFLNEEHSPGITELGFAPPSVLDAGPIPNQTIFLLNRPYYTDNIYYNSINP